jgi:murein DD-endopeptidase MepM/ murein hydrolase activator NlpD
MIRRMRGAWHLGGTIAAAALLSACIPGSGRAPVEPELRPGSNSPTPSPRPTTVRGEPDDLLADIPLRVPDNATRWSAQPVAASAREVAARSYTVQPGDTLRGIGNRTGAGSEEIARANNLPPPYLIRPGQVLQIPGGRYHEVVSGQTGIAIARAYGVPWNAIIAENSLTEPFVLRIGQRLRLPAGAAQRPLSIEEQAQAFTLDIDSIMTGARTAEASVPPRAAITAPLPPAAPVAGYAFQWPVTGRIVARFGPAGLGRVNNGIRIAAPLGTPVRAARAGRVVYAGSEIGLLGGLILIEHDGGWHSAYGHLDRVAVHNGDRVAAGAIIATVGETGQVPSPQLHFEIRRNRATVDPLRQLPPS